MNLNGLKFAGNATTMWIERQEDLASLETFQIIGNYFRKWSHLAGIAPVANTGAAKTPGEFQKHCFSVV